MGTLLSIDLSSSCTGYAVFDTESKKLLTYGFIKGKIVKDSSKWRATLRRLEQMSEDVLNVIKNYKPTEIVIEEITGSGISSRLSQKTLDMTHGILWKTIEPYLDMVEYCDVSGTSGWRTNLGLKLDDADKLANKEAKNLNKKIAKGITKLPIVGPKHLAARYVNAKYGLVLDVDESTHDSDVSDAIALGSYWLNRY